MKRFKAIPTLLATVVLSGCASERLSIEVVGARAWEMEIGEGNGGEPEIRCLLPGLEESVEAAEGWIDFESNPYSFVQPFEIRTGVPNAYTRGSLETEVITLNRVVVEYRGPPDRPDIDRELEFLDLAVYLYAVIESGGGRLIIPLNLVPEMRARQLESILVPEPGDTQTIIAGFFLEGHTSNGRSLSSPTFDFAITLGNRSDICDDGRCWCSSHGY